MCVDFRKRNAHTIPINYPMPHPQEALDSFAGFTIFSTLDPVSGFHQISVSNQDRHKAALEVPKASMGSRLYVLKQQFATVTVKGMRNLFQCARSKKLKKSFQCAVWLDERMMQVMNHSTKQQNTLITIETIQQHMVFTDMGP